MRPSSLFIFTLTVSALSLLLSCSSSESPQSISSKSELKVSYVDFEGEAPTAKLLIEGMSCERMCVSAVKKSMAEVPSVSIEDMLFNADVAVDTLIVHFDPKMVSEKELVKAVESLAGGGTYHVKEIQLSKDAKTSCNCNDSKKKKTINVSEPRSYTFSVPNPFEILRKVSL